MSQWEVLADREDPAKAEVRPAAPAPLQPGEVRLALEKLAMTTNNATYARFGDDGVIPFWNAFPGPEGYGRPPVWAYVKVTESAHPDVAVGGRFYGYVPMSSHHVIAAQPVDGGLMDTSPQRSFLHPWYLTFEPAGEPDPLDDRKAAVHPVYPAAYNLADLLERKADEGARAVVLTSASSKVSIGLAAELAHRGTGLRRIGLTSRGNAAFVAGLGLYDEVATYDAPASAEQGGPIVFVDVTGDPDLRRGVAGHHAANLAATVLVGFTHPAASVLPPPDMPGPDPEVFFTPAVEGQTAQEEGQEVYRARYAAAERRFLEHSTSWLTVRNGQGPEEIVAAYQALLAGEQRPDEIVALTP
ncbi:DUF2855 family protein [Nonomuraea sp. MG754425]|uniref:DUF2855 family protein n=1 Tax=Nonomuraea sp. MG754425 TaxID=2570319 RepID=UPI001F2169B4|nr:DUF2855 family protein [Nonomuraea sp. MG754425]MCF6469951.1 DUF2855 family protein [Nonomuraea sp. MG754425]